MAGKTVGVLALQGAFREHVAVLRGLDVTAEPVRTREQLDAVDALVLPGGESTAMVRIAAREELMPAIRERVEAGMPVLGTCAGLILLADDVLDPGALDGFDRVGGLPISVRRNAYGRQLASGERDVILTDGSRARGVFIRAPRIEAVSAAVEVLARDDVTPVVVRYGNLIGCAFHPELAGNDTMHRRFLSLL